MGIMGCMAQNRGAALLDQLPDLDLVVGTQKFHQVPDHLDNLLASLRGLGPRPSTIVDIAEERGSQNALRGHDPQPRVCAFVSIMQGCDMRCSYCIVPKTRGAERARPMEDIVEETRELVAGGAREVTLLGQIVNHYGRREYPVAAGKTPFVQLLEKLHDIAGLERIRFTSPHPVGFRADLVRCYRDLPKLCEYVHLPAQSGSDRILRAMRRPHTRARYLEIVAALRDAAPGICISTDVIVGFPGETEEDFEQTVSLFDTVRFDMAYVFKYSTRTGTEAEAFGDTVPPAVKDERDKRLLALLEQYSLARNRSLVGSTQEILVEGPARKGDGVLMGRTRTNRKALFRGDLSLAGRLLPVHITGASVTTVTGEIAPPAEAPAAPAPVAQ
ncbi:MAG: tRNA (N6-isopentenyl adenosine(37)-C2)-methylthiotransferase MiaB [Puniceicoccales bacterium]|nr:tRNA (N6-isopentenyl adenosine(37)-C2)-methylthiotransferase MiaB [Puniceicoccales bacterium]